MKLHSKAQQYILDKIQSGEWQVGAQIPPETELAELLKISRPTMRQAMARLTDQGYLVRVKGRGTFISQPKLLHESTSMLWSYGIESAKKGKRLITEVLLQEEIKPDREISERLNIASGKRVTMLTRLRRLEGFNNDNPVLLTTVYVPVSLFPDMKEKDFSNNSFYGEMEKANIFVRYANRELEVTTASEEIAELLKISRFEPVVKVTSVGFLESGEAVEYSESWYPAGCSKFQIRVTR